MYSNDVKRVHLKHIVCMYNATLHEIRMSFLHRFKAMRVKRFFGSARMDSLRKYL